MLDEGLYGGSESKYSSTTEREREEVYAALQYAASFHCLVEEWKDCDELKPKPKVRWKFVDKRRIATKETERCAQANKSSMYEVCQEQQEHEDAQESVRC